MTILLFRNFVFRNCSICNPKIHCRFSSSLNLWNEELSSKIKQQIEEKWKHIIKTPSYNEHETNKEKYYVLSMFPYPSGFLHMGHVRVYTISDTIARYQRMNGKNVIHPIGWDAFGLPAENAAIDRNLEPEEWTKKNIAHMKTQLQQLGCSFEWERELTTCDPHYYKWTQNIFLKLFEAGLVYQKEASVNWDPLDKTVLADEQVDDNGCSWRSGAKVEKKLLKQWFVRTTRYAKDLLDGLDDSVLHDWRDIIKLQRHWIGDCNGVNFDFKLVGSKTEFLTLWTPNPEYLEHVKFIAVSEDHVLAKKENLVDFKKTRVLQSQLFNPINNEKIPVFVTNELEFLDGIDSHIGIPGVFENDANFAKNYNITFNKVDIIENANDLTEKQQNICNKANEMKAGGYWSSAKLRDWLISRQRYWGTPIPIIHCDHCGPQPVPQDQLPVTLPKLAKMSQKGGNQLAEVSEWINTSCPKCNHTAKRETDTMDTFVDSSWYYLRYLDSKNEEDMFDKNKAWKMMPVDLYIGGKEHAVLHLYYARFISHFLYSLGLIPEREPFKRLLVQGMVMGRSFRVQKTGEYLPENKVTDIDFKRNKAVAKATGEKVSIVWEKMSKSKHNGVDPQDMFNEYGTDTTRLLILADVAPTSHRNWNSNTFPGILNWQKRLWLTMKDFLKHRSNLPPMLPSDEFSKFDDFMFDSRNYYIKSTSFNYLISQQLSIAVSKQQGLTNSLRKCPSAIVAHSLQFERALATQIILLAPMAPYFASELWSGFTSAPNQLNKTEEIAWDKTVFEQQWPETDMNYALELICQVNGYANCAIKMERRQLEQLLKEEATEMALTQPKVQETLLKRNILDINFIVHKGCQGILNIITDQPPPKVKVQVQDVK